MFSLTSRALDRVRRQDMYVWLDAHHGAETVIQRLDKRHLFRRVRREELRTQLYIQIERILMVLAIDRNKVLRREGRELRQDRLHLTRENIHTPDDQHVV